MFLIESTISLTSPTYTRVAGDGAGVLGWSRYFHPAPTPTLQSFKYFVFTEPKYDLSMTMTMTTMTMTMGRGRSRNLPKAGKVKNDRLRQPCPIPQSPSPHPSFLYPRIFQPFFPFLFLLSQDFRRWLQYLPQNIYSAAPQHKCPLSSYWTAL